jgi:two-component system sensor histidine kinase KdpD
MAVHRVSFGQRILRLFVALGSVAIVTVIDYRLLRVNSSTAAFSYLLVVLGLATRAGLEPSIAASLASVLCYNFFFLPPIGALTISDPQNWVALCVFLITAITASHLSASNRRRTDEASARRQEMERLYEFSRALMLGDSERSLSRQIAKRVADVFSVQSVAFYDLANDSVGRAGMEESALPEMLLREVARTARNWRDEEQKASIVPVRLGGHLLGSLGWAGMELSDAAVSAIAQLAAIAVERAREQRVANRIEATRQNEQLKATLLDALAHEFKTPLTSIKAAITTVLSQRTHERMEQELLTVVDEETDRLTSLVTETIKIARIGAGQVHLQRQAYSAATLISSVLSNLRSARDGRNIQVTAGDDLPELNVDTDLTELALRQLVGNALKYAPPSSAIRISAEQQDEEFVAIHVDNDGPGIPLAERESIFEKFYRGQDARERIPGTGMGLTITRDIIQAHGGRVWVESAPGSGVRFSFTLPIAARKQDHSPSIA